jgi:hypothetical protein
VRVRGSGVASRLLGRTDVARRAYESAILAADARHFRTAGDTAHADQCLRERAALGYDRAIGSP